MGQRAVLATQSKRRKGKKAGRVENVSISSLIFLVSSNKAVTFEEISVELFKLEVCQCGDSPQPTGLAALFTFSPMRRPRGSNQHNRLSCFLIRTRVAFNWKHVSGDFTSILTVNYLLFPFSLSLSTSLLISEHGHSISLKCETETQMWLIVLRGSWDKRVNETSKWWWRQIFPPADNNTEKQFIFFCVWIYGNNVRISKSDYSESLHCQHRNQIRTFNSYTKYSLQAFFQGTLSANSISVLFIYSQAVCNESKHRDKS